MNTLYVTEHVIFFNIYFTIYLFLDSIYSTAEKKNNQYYSSRAQAANNVQGDNRTNGTYSVCSPAYDILDKPVLLRQIQVIIPRRIYYITLSYFIAGFSNILARS